MHSTEKLVILCTVTRLHSALSVLGVRYGACICLVSCLANFAGLGKTSSFEISPEQNGWGRAEGFAWAVPCLAANRFHLL